MKGRVSEIIFHLMLQLEMRSIRKEMGKWNRIVFDSVVDVDVRFSLLQKEGHEGHRSNLFSDKVFETDSRSELLDESNV